VNKKQLSKIKDHLPLQESIPTRYIIRASKEKIQDKDILFISLFDQKEGNKKHADFKLFINDREYISQKRKEDGSYKWSTARLSNLIHYWWYCYNGNAPVGSCYLKSEKEIIEDHLKIKLAFGEELNAIIKFQEKIMHEKLQKKHEKIKQRINSEMNKIPELPKAFDDWIYTGPLGFSRYIYYKRDKKLIKMYCTECKKDYTVKESPNTKNVKHNSTGTCPHCNKKITYKAIGKSKRVYDQATFAIMQKYENKIAIRYFYGEIEYLKHYRKPKITYWERIRLIYSIDKKDLESKEYEYNYFKNTGELRWCDSTGAFKTSKAYLYTRNIKTVLKGTRFQYSCLYELAKKCKKIKVDSFLYEYEKNPKIEYLIKAKLYNYVNNQISWYPNWGKGNNLQDALGINKIQLRQMQRLNLDEDGLKLIKKASTILDKSVALTDSEVKWVLTNVNHYSDYCNMLNYSTPHKIIRYVNEQSNKKYEKGDVLRDWHDYIEQCKELKFDVKNTFILYPKELKAKHEEYTLLKKAKGVKKYDKKIKQAYMKLTKIYEFKDKDFVIRPAENVDEIVREGHLLRHCVGNSSYINGMAQGDKAILLIREVKNLENPFFTLELNLKDLEVRQCRGYKNRSMTTKVKKFVDKFKDKKLKHKHKVGA
jgi:DNA-directed RNA polymerase subunit RPC12/RpoP